MSPPTGRAAAQGDGYQAVGLAVEEVGPVVERIRRDRPDPDFPISLRTGWDPQGMEPGRIREELAAFTEAGIQHVVAAPWRRELDDWLQSMDLLAGLVL